MRYRSTWRFVGESLEGVALMAGALLSWPVTRRWLKDWGSRAPERTRIWPGDELVRPGVQPSTRAVTIEAPPERVWPWIAQFGLGQAGFYSYELLERVAGIPVTNVESVEPRWQSLQVGDEVKLHPDAPGIPVARVCHGEYVCFGREPGAPAPGTEPGRSWSMYLVPEGNSRCRLVLRGLFEPPGRGDILKRIGGAIEEPIDFVMEQRMLRSIKRLAQSCPADPVRGQGTGSEPG